MANTRQSGKRSREEEKRRIRNIANRSTARSAVAKIMDVIQKKDSAKVLAELKNAVRALRKTASKGAIPDSRAARKIGRLTHLAKKTFPDLFKPTKA